MDTVTLGEVVGFIREERHAVEASVDASGRPQAALVGIAISDGLELVFDTLGSTRKAANLRNRPRIALVVATRDRTVQLEGTAHEPVGADMERARALYFTAFPDGRSRLGWPGITHFVVTPDWLRLSDYRGQEPVIREFNSAELDQFRRENTWSRSFTWSRDV